MCTTFTSLTASLTCGFLASGLAAGSLTGVWATRTPADDASAPPTLCYLTHSVSPTTGASTPYSAAVLDGSRSLALAGATGAAALAAALALFLAAFAASLLRGALSQGLLPLGWLGAAAPRLRAAAAHWAASVAPNALGLCSLARGAGAGWAVLARCPCAGSGGAAGPSAASAAAALAVGALALGADLCAHFAPLPERAPLDDSSHAMGGYLALA